MTKKILFFLLVLTTFKAQSQIVIDNLVPYNTPVYLIDNVLLGGGVVASNHTFQGGPSQIGWFNGVNTNLGIDSGIVMCTGDIYALDPINGGGFPFLPNTVTDPDLLAVANSVPGMIGQSFSVSSINDVAVLEFDFIPTSDSMEFRYAFGSQEYFGYENTQYNDVFGFFLSGPGIAGPWANGAINLAVVPNTNPPLPISISSVNSVTPINQQYFVDNQSGLNIIADVNGFTTVLTAQALVQCGQTYHIKLAIADGSDQGLSSYVWLEAGSFSSTEPGAISIQVNTTDAMCNGDSSGTASISCVQGVTPPYTINWNGQDPNALLAGNYTVHITDANGIVSTQFFIINSSTDISQILNYDGVSLSSIASGGTPTYTYSWLFNNIVIGNTINYSPIQNGDYICVVIDINGCSDSSDIINVSNIPSGIDEVIDASTEIYPNPANNSLNVVSNSIGINTISICNLHAQEVLNTEVNSNQIRLNTSNLAKGVYIIDIRSNDASVKRKLIIE